MITALIIIGIITFFWMFLMCNTIDNKNTTFSGGLFFGIILSLLLAIDIVLLSSILKDPQPTAMDVYQGKTTLEYKVVDNVNVDSVVIFKNDEYGK